MIHSAKYLILKDFEIFSKLDDRTIEQIAYQSDHKKVKKSKYLFESGQKVNSIYIVNKGSFKVGRVTDNDKVLLKELVYKNELLGENFMPLLENTKDFAQALEDSEVIEILKSYFKALLERHPELCQNITQILIQKMSNLESRMSNFVFKKAQSRIVGFLKQLAQTKGIKIGLDEILINHGLSHKEIAYITDTSRQTVARVLGDLKRQNIIHFSTRKPHKILIRSTLNLS